MLCATGCKPVFMQFTEQSEARCSTDLTGLLPLTRMCAQLTAASTGSRYLHDLPFASPLLERPQPLLLQGG